MLVLKLTYRVPMTYERFHGAVEVNGQPVAELPSQPTWCTRDIFVDGDWVVRRCQRNPGVVAN